MTADQFAAATGSRPDELQRLKAYLSLLEKWRRTINLVGPASMADPWRRHILDSAQLIPFIPADTGPLADIGSGAGLPGLAIAILSGRTVHLIESNARKCAFLAEVARATEAPVKIHNLRTEAMKGFNAEVVMARAVAPLPELLELIAPILASDGVALLLKGREAARELTEATKSWKYDEEISPSRTDPHGRVVKLERISRRHV